MRGIDVSQHNGNINWEIVKNNIDFAIVRLGYIGNEEVKKDTQFDRNFSECKRLGIPVGVYVYNYVKSVDRIKTCANWVLDELQGKALDLPVYIDMEAQKIAYLGKGNLTDLCIAFNSIIESSGRWAGVYANLNWYNNYLNKDEIKRRYTTWIAHYGVPKDKYEGQYDILQYSESGRMSGISGGNVDLNIMYRDLVKEITGNKSPEPSKKSIDEISREVINGEWGNGEDRKNRLTSMGYNYQEVQNKVNEMIKPKVRYYKSVSRSCLSLVDALNSIGVNSSFDNRKRIAQKNGINNYVGSAVQNNRLLDRLKAGRLIEV